MKLPVIIINPVSNSSSQAIKYFKRNNIDFVISKSKAGLIDILKEEVNDGNYKFVICGGDGTINNFVNAYMQFPPEIRAKITVGFMPCGTANDLVRFLGLPLKVNLAFKRILKNNVKQIDLIRLNNKYFVTGGGLGLPTEVVQDVNLFTKKHRTLTKKIKDLVYYFFVLKKILFGYKGIKDVYIDEYRQDKRYMMLCVQNQPFIGKRFNLAPNANNSDGVMEICFVERQSNPFLDFLTIRKIIQGTHLRSRQSTEIKTKKSTIFSREPYYFMADGELLDYSDKFELEVLPRSLSVFI